MLSAAQNHRKTGHSEKNWLIASVLQSFPTIFYRINSNFWEGPFYISFLLCKRLILWYKAGCCCTFCVYTRAQSRTKTDVCDVELCSLGWSASWQWSQAQTMSGDCLKEVPATQRSKSFQRCASTLKWCMMSLALFHLPLVEVGGCLGHFPALSALLHHEVGAWHTLGGVCSPRHLVFLSSLHEFCLWWKTTDGTFRKELHLCQWNPGIPALPKKNI